jgi:hypothetical protein
MNKNQKIKSIVILGGAITLGVACGGTETIWDGFIASLIVGLFAPKLVEYIVEEN